MVDLGLPDANGMDVLEEALALYPDIRAVVITGYGSIEGAVDDLHQHFTRPKPQWRLIDRECSGSCNGCGSVHDSTMTHKITTKQ